MAGKGWVLLGFSFAFVIVGTINTLLLAFQDHMGFKHPAVQSALMFLGEALCLVVFLLHKWRAERHFADRGVTVVAKESRWRVRLRFIAATTCDASATTLMNVGMLFTSPSSFQILRGAVVVFTGILSVLLLRRRLGVHHWTGIGLITVGTAIVGLQSVLDPTKNNNGPNVLLGNMLIIAAQFVGGLLFVVEERLLKKYEVPPLEAVGSEGLWGVLMSLIVLPLIYFLPKAYGQQPVDDLGLAVREMQASVWLSLSLAGAVLSIAFFNFLGTSITKLVSAAHRTTIETTRSVTVWIVSLSVGWESFSYIELAGFLVLTYGIFIYNEVLPMPLAYCLACCRPKVSSFADDDGIGAGYADLDGEAGTVAETTSILAKEDPTADPFEDKDALVSFHVPGQTSGGEE